MAEINQSCVDDFTAQISSFIDDINVVRTCYFCKNNYRISSSLGRTECLYHPCNTDPLKGVYMCCGEHKSSRGCEKCDHNELGLFKKKSVHIPIYYYKHGYIKKVPKSNLLDTVVAYNKDKNINSLKTYFKIKVANK